MRTSKKLLVAGVFAAAVAVPYAAAAAPATAPATAPKTAGVVAKDRSAILRTRIQLALERRQLRFDRAANTQRHIRRLGDVAGKVAGKGADVTAVKDLLSQAQGKLDAAKATEQQSVAQFKAVPASADKRAAFKTAKDTAKQAVEQLKGARSLTKQAAEALRSIVKELKSSEGSATAQ